MPLAGVGLEDTMPEEIRYLGDLQLLRIEPGDRFVLTFDGPLSMATRQLIADRWKHFAGDVPLLVLDHGMKLGAIRVKE